jgi:predicted RNA-binding protein YlqC (UPF0109 family)
MEDLLITILKEIVNNPEEVSVQKHVDPEDPSFVKFYIRAHDDDKGIIIGKGGHTISAIRDILSIKAVRQSKKVRLEIVDEEDEVPAPNGEEVEGEVEIDVEEPTEEVDESEDEEDFMTDDILE